MPSYPYPKEKGPGGGQATRAKRDQDQQGKLQGTVYEARLEWQPSSGEEL